MLQPLQDQRDSCGILDKGQVWLLLLKSRLELLELLAVEFAQSPVELSKDFQQNNARSLRDHPLSDDQQVAPAVPLVSLSRQVDNSANQAIDVSAVQTAEVGRQREMLECIIGRLQGFRQSSVRVHCSFGRPWLLETEVRCSVWRLRSGSSSVDEDAQRTWTEAHS